MEAESTPVTVSDDVLVEVWRMKEENAAACGCDVVRIAAEARQRQEESGRVVIRRTVNGDASSADKTR